MKAARRHFLAGARWALVPAVAAFAAPVCAQQSPWYIGLAQSFSHDSNLYRAGEGVALPSGVQRSDTVSSTSLVGGLDQPISRQRVYGSAALRHNRYANNSGLSYDGWGLNLGWDWATVERLSGSLNASSNRTLRPFSVRGTGSTVDTQKNVETVNQLDATARVGVVTRITAEATLGWRDVGYSNANFADSELQVRSASMGLRYRPAAATTFGVALRRAQGDYANRASDYRRNSLDLSVNWVPNAISALNVRVSPTRTRYSESLLSQSALTGAASWNWQATGKIGVTTQLTRDIGQDAYAQQLNVPGQSLVSTVDDSRISTRLSLGARYAATAKISLSANLSHTRRELSVVRGLTGFSPVLVEDRDTTNALNIGARWAPVRSLQVGCDLGTERRSAGGVLSNAYRANTASCFGQFVLQ
jgi:hypothetical protein